MSSRDGTGIRGRGAISGRGLGFCNGANAGCFGTGLGRGQRRGFGKNLGVDPTISKTQKELLQELKEMLESKIAIISKQLESL